MRKKYLCILICLFANALAFASAANRTITGVVISGEDNEPLIGASVYVNADDLKKAGASQTSLGTITDMDGKFSISIPEKVTRLHCSYIGFEEQDIVLQAGKDTYRIVLQASAHTLGDVVVTGYQELERRKLTAAIAKVDVTDGMVGAAKSIDQALAGQIAGVAVTTTSGAPGAPARIRIRGTASLNGTQDPLWVLDGIPLEGTDIPEINKDNDNDIVNMSQSSIAGLSPNDIESITILKDAAATAIYGARAANGVIVVTTKRGKTGKPVINFNTKLTYTPNLNTSRLNLLNSEEKVDLELQLLKEARFDILWGLTDPIPVFPEKGKVAAIMKQYNLIDIYKEQGWNGLTPEAQNAINKLKTINTDWNDILFRDAFTQEYNFSISGGSEKVTYYNSLGYVKENGNVPGVSMSRFNLTSKTSYQINKILKIGMSIFANRRKNNTFMTDTYGLINPTNSSVTQYEAGATWYAPTAWIENGSQVFVNEQGERVDTGGMPAYRFPVEKYYNSSGPGASQVGYQNKSVDNNTFNIYTTYNLQLGAEKEHAFKFMVGMNRVTSKWSLHKGWKTNLIDLTNPQFPLASGDQFIEGDRNWEAQLGFFGRLNYSFEDRYFLEANIRRDGSSKFPKNLQWRWFPSFSAGWVFTNESFMKPVENILSFGKFRASWGSIGDQTVSNTLYKAILADGQSSWLDGSGNKMPLYGTPSLVDSDISWQEIETLDFGVDLRFFKNKFGVTFDWYRRDTKNMIIEGESLPVTLGATAPKGNYGSLRTKGWELSADFTHRFSNGLGINVMASISDATTYITKGADYLTPWEDRKLGTTYSTGRRYGDIYGFVTDRLFQKEDFVYGADGQIEKITVIYNGTAHTTNKQSSPYPVYQVHYEDNNKLIFAPGDVKFVDLDGDGYITPGTGTNGNPGDQTVIGNSTPRYEYSFRLGADYKGIDFSIFFQGIGKRQIWGSGQLAIPGYNAKEGALPKTFTTDYWTEERTDAFYPRAWNLGGSNTGFSMQKQSRYLLDMSYLRIKNITLGYTFPENLLSKVYISKARLYMSLENFFTFDKLNGLPIDPEAISGYSMFDTENYNSGRTGVGTPTFKSVSVGVQLNF